MMKRISEFFAKLFGFSQEYAEMDSYEIQETHIENTRSRAHRRMEDTDVAKINVLEPRVYTEVETVGQLLLRREAVLLNLRRVDESQARRIIDYMAGIAYAINGDIQKLSADIFLCVPENITVGGLEPEIDDTASLDFVDEI